MDFSKITAAVIGLGLMGGSFAMRLKELGAAVIGINRTLSTAEAALRQGIVDSIDISDLKHADIVIFCTPAKATLAFVKDHLPDFRSDAIMTDIAGVKGNLADDIRQILPPGIDFISSHPMCGHEGEGLSRADPDIFRGANYILLPDKTNRPESGTAPKHGAGSRLPPRAVNHTGRTRPPHRLHQRPDPRPCGGADKQPFPERRHKVLYRRIIP